MINWHETNDDLDTIWKRLVDALDLGLAGPLPPEVRADLDGFIFGALQGHGYQLNMGRGATMRTPSGLVIGEYMEALSEPSVDYAYDDDSVSTALNAMFTEAKGKAAELRCVCLAYYVRMAIPGGEPREITIRRTTEWQNKDAVAPPGTIEALAIDLEHRAGFAMAVYLPYNWDDSDKLHVGDLIAGPSHRRIWG
ncbi:hypothetical protein [Actinomadura alba]|uniref:Uncharacterized protein n=1 Tax=Actinomadura alba TaxID=406431 RepID=A0ABR7LPP4_9ACTN|nr:hypothetical protein [Actinomadura alba]MBC6466817.1 hypothetical protein [Actinomadura alba]